MGAASVVIRVITKWLGTPASRWTFLPEPFLSRHVTICRGPALQLHAREGAALSPRWMCVWNGRHGSEVRPRSQRSPDWWPVCVEQALLARLGQVRFARVPCGSATPNKHRPLSKVQINMDTRYVPSTAGIPRNLFPPGTLDLPNKSNNSVIWTSPLCVSYSVCA